MRPSPARLIRLVPRSSVSGAKKFVPALDQRPIVKPPTLIETMQARQQAAGSNWPANIRIEPVVRREDFKGVPKKTRAQLLAMMRET
ncbi:hypothetical protein CYLTODRAFT_399979 [Cylindrobasidium torrendii FP15055 ss-10]|uniref:Uncharacterized protein n=1 Tax=Cylindrobasidium torrendii FP15055 ss-10 TaxID=1314674 RepID=A0A0D7B5F4_9AGAR|nr:hypothetical protein CYLTODRAFT_399979 [Cylindrobasidium torrendii FP15055 ss-10]